MDRQQLMESRIPIVEIFKSISGEGISAGTVMSFVRVAGCNLRCNYCDTTYSYAPGHDCQYLTPDEVVAVLRDLRCRNVLCTGGEPLECRQPKRYLPLFLAAQEFAVRIETNGSCPLYTQEEIAEFAGLETDLTLNYVLDVKCPDSGMSDHNIYLENFERLSDGDELKFVVSSQRDLDFSLAIIDRFAPLLSARGVVINFSPVFGRIHPAEIVDMLKENAAGFEEKKLQARLSLQLHKIIWDPTARGV